MPIGNDPIPPNAEPLVLQVHDLDAALAFYGSLAVARSDHAAFITADGEGIHLVQSDQNVSAR